MARFDITREPPVAQLLPWVEINNVIFERVELTGKKADYGVHCVHRWINGWKPEKGCAGIIVQDQDGNML